VFDGATTAGDYVQISSSTAGDCHDAGAARPATGEIIGRVLSTNASAGTYALRIFETENMGASATIASGTATMTTALIASLACGTTVTVAGAGVATTDSIHWSYNAAVGANPGRLIVNAWPTAGNVNFEYCNPTAAGVTPTAATLNWRVTR
jgi:hypothetical protein